MKQKTYLLFVLTLFLPFTHGLSQTDVNYAKAVYIYNFLSHISLEDNKQSDKITIGVIGKTKTYDHLRKYTAKRKVGNKEIEIILVESASQYQKCQVILIAEDSSSLLNKINQNIGNNSCLIIGEQQGLTKMGAAIEFVLDNNKLGYKLNKINAEKHNVLVSKSLEHMSN
jgi:hypothetical protein